MAPKRTRPAAGKHRAPRRHRRKHRGSPVGLAALSVLTVVVVGTMLVGLIGTSEQEAFPATDVGPGQPGAPASAPADPSAAPTQAVPDTRPCAAGYVRLTFDDGPAVNATPAVLDTLAAWRATATFFVTGAEVAAHPDLVRRASEEGHRIGNHSWSHPDLTRLDQAQVASQLQRTSDVIEQVTGHAPTEWRPPYGATNDLVAAAAQNVGLNPPVLWTVDPRDWADPPATTIRDRVLQGLRPGGIVLLHDATGANTATALPMILAGLTDRGYCTQ